MTRPLSSARNKGNSNDANLRLLSLLHYAAAGLSFVGVALLAWQYARMRHAFLDLAASKKNNGGDPSLEEFLLLFREFYLVFGSVVGALGIGDLLSGFFIARRRNRAFSMAVASLNCILVPLGTILGAYSMVLLLRDSVRGAYAAEASGQPAPRAAAADPGRKGRAR